MTPAQEAKDYAAQHGFTIITLGRRYIINHQESPYDTFVAEVGGYPAALNAMKRYVQEQAESAALEQARATGKVGALVGDVNAEIMDSGRMVADFPFEDVASKARRIHKAVPNLTEWVSRNPWHIVIAGRLSFTAFATRSDALKEVRRRLAGETGVRIVYMGA